MGANKFAILWMKRLHPPEIRSLLSAKTREFQPPLIEKFDTSIVECAPPQAWQCFDKIEELELHFTRTVCSALSGTLGMAAEPPTTGAATDWHSHNSARRGGFLSRSMPITDLQGTARLGRV